ncbi:class I lanthipeptide [Lacinutrix sp.]|nr:class I lanthipeptide [Lacinutrix sp.]
MKKQNRNLSFNKSSLIELNDGQLQDVNGGSTPTTITIGITISLFIFK